MTMQQLMGMMQGLQEAMTASKTEQERMEEDLAASQARNDELHRANEELRLGWRDVYEPDAPKRLMYSFRVSPWYCFTSMRLYETGAGALFAKYCSLNSGESCAKDVMWPSGRLMNQSIAIPVRVLIKSLHLTASEPPTNIICVWNAVRSASGSSIPVKVTLGPVNVLGIADSRIGCENGVVNSLGGDVASGSSPPRHP